MNRRQLLAPLIRGPDDLGMLKRQNRHERRNSVSVPSLRPGARGATTPHLAPLAERAGGVIGSGGQPAWRSAELHSAVSRICHLRSVLTSNASAMSDAQPKAIRRYSRLQICATTAAGGTLLINDLAGRPGVVFTSSPVSDVAALPDRNGELHALRPGPPGEKGKDEE